MTISRHPDVAKISFTGSTNTGKAIPRGNAAKAKRVTLELGGKSPTILLDDVDLAQAIPLVIRAGFMNSGQACVAGRAFWCLIRARRSKPLAQAVAAVKSATRATARDVGPMVSEKQCCGCRGHIRQKGIEEGAPAGGRRRATGRQCGTAGLCVRRCLPA